MHETKTVSHHSKHHFITQCIEEFYRMIRMGVPSHVRGNRTKTNE